MLMRDRIQWIIASTVVLLIVSSLILLAYYQLPPELQRLIVHVVKKYSSYLFLAAILVVALLIFAIDLFLRLLIAPLNKLAEETSLIGIANSKHRINIQGSGVVSRLVRAINAIAMRFEAMQEYDQNKIQHIKAEAEKERNILAAIMAELSEGVLICNSEGDILLYNQQVKQFLSGNAETGYVAESQDANPGSYIGLGRSVYAVIDRNRVQHALDEINEKRRQKENNIAAYFVAESITKELLRVEVVPILNHRDQFAGFILIFQDITRHLATAAQVEYTLKALGREIRSAAAGIRSAIETIIEYPDMEGRQLGKFKEIIHKEAVTLGTILDKTTLNSRDHITTEWPLARMPASDLLEMIAAKASEKLKVKIHLDSEQPVYCVKADSYSLTLAILFVLTQILAETASVVFTGSIEKDGRYINFDLSWNGPPVKIEMLRKWSSQIVMLETERLPFTLRAVLGHHKAEICAVSPIRQNHTATLRFFMPICEDAFTDPVRRMAILPQSRPEFFDFDLFRHAERHPEAAHRLLTELNYTVFDTETTGLNPSGGDEIISIAAVRIVNGRLLREECFDQLIDPRRTISKSSIMIHGIQPEMLVDRPIIDQVLPRFHQFAADTILLAHNAAFDMRLLQMKEASSGIKFTNPVLDTLLLSAVVHPAQTDHSLEAISDRLGVAIVGRHTAMGDAIVTGKLFLKMIPLLADKGIFTLPEAIAASKRTYYARIKY